MEYETDQNKTLPNGGHKERFKERDKWANKTEFLLSCLGYAIGIGNVWRFPYLCYRNGGGAFLIPYLFMLFFCGIPLFFMETSLGQFASTGCITLFKICPLFKGAGYAIVIVNFIVTTYFNTICSYPLIFLVHCFQSKLPWTDCDNSWNTEHCAKLDSIQSHLNDTFSSDVNLRRLQSMKTPADEFFHRKILQISDGIDNIGEIVWPLLTASTISWIITYLCIIKGVKTVGKVVYFTATFPFFILFVLLIRGLTLPGAWDGIYFYIYPQWDQLTNLKVWADAAIQIFFSLGPGWGGIVNMASYNQFKNNNKWDSIIVPVVNCATSIFAGFVVFSVIGFMAHETGLPLATVATGGPGLAFVTYPEAISLLPWPQLWAILFFLMLFFLGLDSMFVQIESIISSIVDEYPILRKWQGWVTLFAIIWMMGLSTIYSTNGGMYWVQLFDWYAASVSIVLICLVEVFIVGWTYGVKKFTRDVEIMIEEKVSWFWIISWKFTTPTVLLFIFVTVLVFNTKVSYHGIEYPDWAVSLGWNSCYLSMACIPVYMGYRLLYLEKGDLIERLKSSIRASPEWAPAKNEDRVAWAKLALQDLIRNGDREERDPVHQQFIQLSTVQTYC